MKLPPKPILIRLLIYIPVLSILSYVTLCNKSGPTTTTGAPELEGRKTKFTLPDGKSVEVVEISEDQARKLGFNPDGDKPAEAAAKAPPAGEAGVTAAPPAGAN